MGGSEMSANVINGLMHRSKNDSSFGLGGIAPKGTTTSTIGVRPSDSLYGLANGFVRQEKTSHLT